MIIVGLTGGIASGKTTIINFLKKKRYVTHDSDAVVKEIYSAPTPNLIKVLKSIGLSDSINNKKINKNMIREEIFRNQRKKRMLEKFIHNKVRRSREQFIKKHKKKKTKILILDIPLLFEARLSHICDYVILLYVSKKTKIQRAISRGGITKQTILQILKHQLGDPYKKKKADFIINTSKPKKHSFKMILDAITNIMKNNA